MSLEKVIEDLTTAIREHTLVLTAQATGLAIQRAAADAMAQKAKTTPLTAEAPPERAAADAMAEKAKTTPLTAGEAAQALDGQHAGKPGVTKGKEKKATPAPTPAAAPAPAPAPAATTAQGNATMPYELLREKILDVAAKFGGNTRVQEMLKPYGASRGQELKPEQYADVYRDAMAILNGTAESIA